MIVYRYILFSQRSGTVVWNSSLKLKILYICFPVNNCTATRCHFKIHYYHPFYLLQIFTFSIQIMFSSISCEANDPQGLMRRQAPNKQAHNVLVVTHHLPYVMYFYRYDINISKFILPISFVTLLSLFFNPHRLTLTLSDANDPLGLMRR